MSQYTTSKYLYIKTSLLGELTIVDFVKYSKRCQTSGYIFIKYQGLNMTLIKSLRLSLFIITTLLVTTACSSKELKKDESVVLFPISANKTEAGWEFTIHSWVFEKEEKSLSRIVAQKSLKEVFESIGEVTDNSDNAATLQRRFMWFLVDNKQKKEIQTLLNGQLITLAKTAANGHAKTLLSVNKEVPNGEWQSFKVKDNYQRNFQGEIQFIPQQGLSVISDIDDTIKVSQVLDKKELLINTFVKPYRVTKGFPEYYKELAAQGAYFHYISASPWQLYPSLKPFLEKYYPKGTITLRNFRIKDSSLLAFFKPSTGYKIKQIQNLIRRYPKHQFILIGDSGEHDPEVYATIYQQFPDNIQSIQIRAVEGSNLTDKRFKEIFKHIPKNSWRLLP